MTQNLKKGAFCFMKFNQRLLVTSCVGIIHGIKVVIFYEGLGSQLFINLKTTLTVWWNVLYVNKSLQYKHYLI